MSKENSDEQRRAVLKALLAEAAFDGWTQATLDMAAEKAGIDAASRLRGDLKLLFPRGIPDVLDFWAAEEDHAMTSAFDALDAPPAKIREKVTWLVRQRIVQMTPYREAARRAAATLALPLNAPLGARLSWRTVGAIWQALGDKSTDLNWYTKRASLSAVYLSTIAHWFADDGEDEEEPHASTWRFLDDRIGNVMEFEKWKAKTTKQAEKLAFDPAQIANFFGRIRYGDSK